MKIIVDEIPNELGCLFSKYSPRDGKYHCILKMKLCSRSDTDRTLRDTADSKCDLKYIDDEIRKCPYLETFSNVVYGNTT